MLIFEMAGKNMLYTDNAMEPFTMQNTSRSDAHGLCFVVDGSPFY